MSRDGRLWTAVAGDLALRDALSVASSNKAARILSDMNPVQALLIEDPSLFKGGICPRRAGKSHAGTGYAMHVGESRAGSRVLIISLTLKSVKENFWDMAPGGVQAFNTKYDLDLETNSQSVSWKHPNGSVGFLAGAETAADLERLRGSKVEADLIIVDECASFAPDRLRALIMDVLMPGLMTRNGTLVLIGTPGSIPQGLFYEATCERSLRTDKTPTCIVYGSPRPDEDDDIPRWSLHHWTLRDNVARPDQWERALLNKRMQGWGDDHPSWRREYLGEWVESVSERVYSYADCLPDGKVSWPGGTLPESEGPWHLILGLDFGYEDDFAMVVAAYGEHSGELRHVWDWKAPHLTFDRMVEEVEAATVRFGNFETIVADAGGLGKVLVETMSARGLPIIRADKHEKFDYVELLNSDFHAGRVLIIPDTELHTELSGLQYDLSRGAKEHLARTGRLKESPRCPNHLCDALLYLWRYSYHAFGRAKASQVAVGSPDWWTQREAAIKKSVEGLASRELAAGHGEVDHLVTRERFGLR